MGSPRDIKTRVKLLHRGRCTQHRAFFARVRRHLPVCTVYTYNVVLRKALSAIFPRCNAARGIHSHIDTCTTSLPLLLAKMLGQTTLFTKSDLIYGTQNKGKYMPKGLLTSTVSSSNTYGWHTAPSLRKMSTSTANSSGNGW